MNDINRALSFQEHLRPGELQVIGMFISESIACRYFMTEDCGSWMCVMKKVQSFSSMSY